MNCALDLARRGGAAGLAVEVGGAAQFHDLAAGVFDHFVALDDVGVFQPDFAARFQPEIFRRRHFGEIVAARCTVRG